jgi:hypothetical protein
MDKSNVSIRMIVTDPDSGEVLHRTVFEWNGLNYTALCALQDIGTAAIDQMKLMREAAIAEKAAKKGGSKSE